MPIEEDISEASKKLTFFKNLPEFIDRAKYLERRLKEGEKLLFGVDKFEIRDPSQETADFIYLDIKRTEGKLKRERVVTFTCLGDMIYKTDIFKDYRPPPEAQIRFT